MFFFIGGEDSFAGGCCGCAEVEVDGGWGGWIGGGDGFLAVCEAGRGGGGDVVGGLEGEAADFVEAAEGLEFAHCGSVAGGAGGYCGNWVCVGVVVPEREGAIGAACLVALGDGLADAHADRQETGLYLSGENRALEGRVVRWARGGISGGGRGSAEEGSDLALRGIAGCAGELPLGARTRHFLDLLIEAATGILDGRNRQITSAVDV